MVPSEFDALNGAGTAAGAVGVAGLARFCPVDQLRSQMVAAILRIRVRAWRA